MLGNITHIFQIPLRWFLAVDAKCFNFTPGHMLCARVNDQGGDVLSVDREAFDAAVRAAVREVVGETPEEACTVKSVDGHEPDADGAVSFGLAGDKWLKTDATGHIATADETPVALPSGKTGVSQTVDVVTSLSWTGTQLVAGNATITLTNGVVTAVAKKANTVINTVTY